jgi:hypothetical protein
MRSATIFMVTGVIIVALTSFLIIGENQIYWGSSKPFNDLTQEPAFNTESLPQLGAG